MANKVFEDRLGLLVMESDTPDHFSDKLVDRLPRIKAFPIPDVFLPRSARPIDFATVRMSELYGHLWVAPDGLSARDLANRTLLDIERLKPGAVELNLELPSDPPLPAYIRECVTLIRTKRPNLRMRINVAPWKGFALPADLLASDGALYACEQNYEGNMDNLLSPADVLQNMLDRDVLYHKTTVCYAAACRVLDSPERLRTLPDLGRTKRGVIFSDDLMVSVGVL